MWKKALSGSHDRHKPSTIPYKGPSTRRKPPNSPTSQKSSKTPSVENKTDSKLPLTALERVMAARRGKAPPIPSYLNDDSSDTSSDEGEEVSKPMSRQDQQKQIRRRERAVVQMEKEFTRDEREARMKKMFEIADTDNSGTLDKDELRICLQNAGFGFSKAEIEFMVVESDADGDGGVDFNEFIPLCYEMMIENLAKSLPDEEAVKAEQDAFKKQQQAEWKANPGMPLLHGTLVGHWEVMSDDNGNLYYYHRRSQQSVWDAPAEILQHAAKLAKRNKKVERRTIFGEAGKLRKKKLAIAAAKAAGRAIEENLGEKIAPSVAAQLASFSAKKWALRAAVKSSQAQLVLNELHKKRRQKEKEMKAQQEKKEISDRLAAETPREVREAREIERLKKEEHDKFYRNRKMVELEKELLDILKHTSYPASESAPAMALGCGKGAQEPKILVELMKQLVRRAENKAYFNRTNTVLEFDAVKNCFQQALWTSCERGWEDTVAICVKVASDPRELVSLGKKNNTGETPLALSCRHFRFGNVNTLMSGSITLSKPCFSRGRSALHWACDAEASRLPLNKMTQHESKEQYKKRKLQRENGVLALVNILIDNGAMLEPLDDGCRTPLHLAAQREDSRITRALLNAKSTRKGGDKKYRSDAQALRGETPLHEAAKYGRVENIKLLLDAGAIVNSPTFGREDTAAHWAAGAGQTEALRVLLDAKTPVHIHDRCGRAPIHIAAAKGHTSTITLLLERGASLNAPDGGGLSPLHYAVKAGHLDATILIIESGGDQHVKTRSGMNLLHLASMRGYLLLAQKLLEKGVDAEEPDNRGRTPVQLAENHGKTKVCGFFHTPLAKNLAARNQLERIN